MEMYAICTKINDGSELLHNRRVYELVDVFIDERGSVIKNRYGEKTIQGAILSCLSGKNMAIKSNEYIEIFITKKDESKFKILIVELIEKYGLKILEKVKVKIVN